MLQQLLGPQHQPVHHHRRGRQDHHAGHDQVHVEHLGPVDDEIAQARPGHEKFPHDHPHPRQAHVDLQGVEQGGEAGGKHQHPQNLTSCGPQGPHQPQLFAVGPQEALIHAEDGDDQGDGQGHHDDGPHPRPHPDDKDRPQGRFRQGVQNHQIGAEHPGHPLPPPHTDGDGGAQQGPGQEAHHGLQA